MKFIRFFILLALTFFVFKQSYSLPGDSLKKEIKLPTVIKFIDEFAFETEDPVYHTLDTTINDFEELDPAKKEHYNNLANIGSAASPQIFMPPDNILTDIGIHSYDLYLFNQHTIRYFKSNKAYSEISYHLAGGKEQQIKIALSKNIFKNWNVGLDFNRLGSDGFMKNGLTYHSNVDLYSWVHSKNQRYNLLASAIWNTIQNKVNGGLQSDSIYNNTVVDNFALEGLQVNLNDAENHFRNKRFEIRQFYDLGLKIKKADNDTLNPQRIKSTFRIEHTINLEQRSFAYQDNTSGDYYTNSFFSATTRDSLHFSDLRNLVRLAWFDKFSDRQSAWKPSTINLSWENQWLEFTQFAYENIQFPDTLFQSNALEASMNNRIDSTHVFYELSGNFVFDGAAKNNYKADLTIQIPLNKFGNIKLSGQVFLKTPEFIFQRYYSNHFIWDSPLAFDNEWKTGGIHYSLDKYHFSVGVEATSISHFTHFDSNALPVQESGETKVIKYLLTKDFQFRKIHFNNSFVFQKMNLEESIHLPDLISTQSLYYESFFFKNALLFQTGIDLHYSSSYASDGFMPATGMFYWQNEIKTNGYAMIDVFVNFKIKSARFTFKLENIGDNIIDEGYYLTPHYPMQGMTFKFGITWRFFDQ